MQKWLRLWRSLAQAELASGKWVAVRPNKSVWHLADANLPASLFGEEGKATHSARSVVRPFSLRRSVKLLALRTALRLERIRGLGVDDHSDHRNRASVLVLVESRRSEFLSLCPGERAVRVGRAGSYDARYVDVRLRFSRHVPTPSFSVSEDGSALTEAWLDGPLLSDLAIPARLPHVLGVLDDYTTLISEEATTQIDSAWQHFPAFLAQLPVSPELAQVLADEPVLQLLNTPLLSPAQGDLRHHNVIVGASGGSPTVIDFDHADWLPVWFDPVVLASWTLSRWADSGVSGLNYAEKDLSDALDRVVAAAGLRHDGGLTARHLRALTAVGHVFMTTADRRTANLRDVEGTPNLVASAARFAEEKFRLGL